MGSSWKATALLTWLLAAESVHGLPQSQPIGSVAESILEQTATEPSTSFKTQYPPSNSEARVFIPEASPVYRIALDKQGHPSEPPFPSTNVDRVLDGIVDLLSPNNSSTNPAPSATSVLPATAPATVASPTEVSGQSPSTDLPGPPDSIADLLSPSDSSTNPAPSATSILPATAPATVASPTDVSGQSPSTNLPGPLDSIADLLSPNDSSNNPAPSATSVLPTTAPATVASPTEVSGQSPSTDLPGPPDSIADLLSPSDSSTNPAPSATSVLPTTAPATVASPTDVSGQGRSTDLPGPLDSIADLLSPSDSSTNPAPSATSVLPTTAPATVASPADVPGQGSSTDLPGPPDSIADLLSPSDSSTNPAPSATSVLPATGPATVASPTDVLGQGSSTDLPGPPDSPDYPSTMDDQDVFEPVATNAPPANIKARHDHPVKNLHANTSHPIETNKFYAGLFLGTQTNASFTQPYSLGWSRGQGTLKSFGVGVSHLEAKVLAFGPKNHKLPGSPAEYYINPVGLQHIVLSATELDKSSVLDVEEPKAFSAHAVLKRSAGSHHSITFPVVQGMGFITGIYNRLQPLIESGVFFRKVVSAGSPKPGIFKYQVALEDDTHWVLYASPNDGIDPNLKLVSKSRIRGTHGFSGAIQVAKNPAGKSGEKFYDNSAGVYPVSGHITGSVTGDTGSYSLAWAKAGKHAHGTPLIMFALPHHLESFDRDTAARVTSIHLRSTTKGNATAVIGDSWTMVEPDLPVDMGFAPWSATSGNVHTLSPEAKKAIVQVAPYELQQNISQESNLNSMYYSGKALSKFATLVWTVSQLGGDLHAASDAFQELKSSFARFVNNQQEYPLAYDSVWKGVVSTAGYKGDLNQDFGNTAYNDHHFHYGYFIQAAAIIGSLDSNWLAQNKDWVNMLVRDAGNSVENDPHFPFSRAFDWFNGHSWAKGLFESYDGKDEESTSEDTMFAYAVKMWGRTIGDVSMEARGNLMLGIMRRSLDNYFLMRNNNVNQPSKFIGNKVTGILFENKVDHTTYFGNNLEFIQGIHMIPLLPNSAYTRTPQFVAEEWEAIFAPNASTPADKVEGGWKGVLFANLALVNPKASWSFFAQHHFNYSWIDGGATRTWYLAYAAALGGL